MFEDPGAWSVEHVMGIQAGVCMCMYVCVPLFYLFFFSQCGLWLSLAIKSVIGAGVICLLH